MSPHQQQYYQHVLATLNQVFLTQSAEVEQAATLFAECVKANGIIHGFGSGHSFAAAVELAGRAGGLVNTKAIDQFYGPTGWFDSHLLRAARSARVRLLCDYLQLRH